MPLRLQNTKIHKELANSTLNSVSSLNLCAQKDFSTFQLLHSYHYSIFPYPKDKQFVLLSNNYCPDNSTFTHSLSDAEFSYVSGSQGVTIIGMSFEIVLIKSRYHNMFRFNLKIALRNIWKYKAFSLINIIGLAIGMACSILILLWVQFEYSFDKFHENKKVYRVIQNIIFDKEVHWAISQGPLGPSLKDEVPEIEEYCRIQNSGRTLKWKEDEFPERGVYADSSFFDFFTFPVLRQQGEHVFNGLNCILLSERLAEKIFGNTEPLG